MSYPDLWKYIGMGYDLVCFTDGKKIAGSQIAGLLQGSTGQARYIRRADTSSAKRRLSEAPQYLIGLDHQYN
jgi:seryl-tRNA(Sec) selenium transferase